MHIMAGASIGGKTFSENVFGPIKPCKWLPDPKQFNLSHMADFVKSPLHGTSELHHLVRDGVCGALSDNPWWMLYPSLMSAYPDAKFILTTRPDAPDRCARWLKSVKGVWSRFNNQGGGFSPGYRSFHRCVFGSNELNEITEGHYLHRCHMHDAHVRAHAAALQVPLLELPINWNSTQKWSALGSFLDMDTSKLVAENTEYPWLK